jgi:hypothetical protein
MKKSEPKLSHRMTRWTDHRLILLCVRVGQSIGGMSGSFDIDPTGNNDFAETIDGTPWKERVEAFAALSKLRAKTAAGVSAKARLVPLLLEHREGSELTCHDRKFILSVAEDVQNLVAPMVSNDPDEGQSGVQP